MTGNTGASTRSMPHHKLVAYEVALELLEAAVACKLKNADLRQQALRSARSCCLNIAEAAGRWSLADRARIFQIARGECCELAAAVEIAGLTGELDPARALAVARLSDRLYALLTGLVRRAGS